MANKPPAFQFYAADFDTDTAAWTNEEIGAYIRLLCFAWINRGLPNDVDRLASIARTSQEYFRHDLWPALAKKFTADGEGNLVSRRMEEVRAEQEAWREKSRRGGLASGKARRKKKKGTEPPLEPKGEPKAKQKATLQSSVFSLRSSPSSLSSGREDDGAGAPPQPQDCPHEKIITLYHEMLPELSRVKVWHKQRMQHLQARWREDPERQSLTWWRGFFGIVKASPFLLGQVPGKGGRSSFVATLAWLVMPENFAKVIEGFYLRRGEDGSFEGARIWLKEKERQDGAGGQGKILSDDAEYEGKPAIADETDPKRGSPED